VSPPAATRVFIHAGPGKTGTSAVQYWLQTNRELLLERGVFYPAHNLDRNRVSAGNGGSLFWKNDKGQWQVDREGVERLKKRFARSGCDTLLLSSELFFSQVEALDALFPDAVFILYLRDPVELLESGYNQSIKRHGAVHRFAIPENLRHPHLGQMRHLLAALGHERVVIRPYSPDSFQGGNIVSDLLGVAGLGQVAPEAIGTVNPPYSLEALEFKRRLNRLPLGALDRQVDMCLQGFEGGTRSFTFLDARQRERLRGQAAAMLREFISECSQPRLDALLSAVAEPAEPAILAQQGPGCVELAEVVRHLQEREGKVARRIAQRMAGNRYLYVDEPELLELFGIRADFGALEPDPRLLEYVECMNVHPSRHKFVLRELAAYYCEMGELATAMRIVHSAHQIAPEDERLLAFGNQVFRRLGENASGAVRVERDRNGYPCLAADRGAAAAAGEQAVAALREGVKSRSWLRELARRISGR